MRLNETYHNIRYWADYWNEITSSAKNRGPMQAGFWNRMAEKYDRNQDPDKEEARISRIIDFIQSTGVTLSGAEVLDIGAGTGTLAIPLTRAGARVTALDFSDGMLKKLSARAETEGVTVHSILQRNWDEIDLVEEGMQGRYDLVIASMTPGVRDPDTFQKMLDAAKGVCYYSGWVNRKWDPSYYELYRILWEDEFREGMHGIYLPFMYLSLLGYHPDLELSREVWMNDETVDEAVESVCGFFHTTREISEPVKERIREYYRVRTTDGRIRSETMATIGMMVWDMAHKPHVL